MTPAPAHISAFAAPQPAALLLWLLLPFLAFLALLLPSGALGQDDAAQAREQLENLQQQITEVTRELKQARSQQGELQAQLEAAEVALGQLRQQISTTREQIGATEAELAALGEQQAGLEARLDQQRQRLAEELETAWKMGQQQQLKVLLSQESPHTLARAMAYYRYFFEARQALLESFRQNLAELAGVREQIEDQRQQLAARQAELSGQRERAAQQQAARSRAVNELAARIADRDATLEQLQADRQELEQLLETIERAVIDMQLPDNYQAFADARGAMPWPVAGKRGNEFGRARNAGKMRWQGVNIQAEAGETVRAIHHGRVVYADWFRGSGLLLIIDHGDGYMSLYAHNQSLLREVGEWVSAGSPVSTVGSSGGLESPALYFEIRKDGKPTDPGGWCRG